MRKTDKRLEKSLIVALNEACELALKDIKGFQWLTHFANYSYFPGSLSVVCVFDTNESLSKLLENDNGDSLRNLIESKLASVDIKVRDIKAHVTFDTEEDCERENNGKWNERFK